jgi:putative MFS transporter
MPESPRFLLGNRRRSEAHAVMRTFGIVVTGKEPETHEPESESPAHGIFRRPHTAITFTLILFGLAWGLANFGFLVWLPTYVARNGISAGAVTAILAKAALFAIPVAPLFSWLYGRWSSRSTLILAAGSTATTLGLFALFGSAITRSSALFTALVVALLVSMWASISVLAPYSAEVYPTHKRSAGSGVAAAASKLGGVLALAMSVAAVAPPSVAGAALLAAIPAALAALMLAVFGVETRGRRLEEITSPVALETARQLHHQARSASGSERKSALIPSSRWLCGAERGGSRSLVPLLPGVHCRQSRRAPNSGSTLTG